MDHCCKLGLVCESVQPHLLDLSPPPGTYLVDSNAVSISGLSSGGYFAVQFHVAFSKTIMGAGILAGGEFHQAVPLPSNSTSGWYILLPLPSNTGALGTRLPAHILYSPGPYWCANDNLSTALTTCMVNPDLISVTELVAITHATANTGTIDPPSYLTHDHVYLYSGKLDTVVHPGMRIWLQELPA